MNSKSSSQKHEEILRKNKSLDKEKKKFLFFAKKFFFFREKPSIEFLHHTIEARFQQMQNSLAKHKCRLQAFKKRLMQYFYFRQEVQTRENDISL